MGRNAEKEHHWREVITRQRESGLSRRAYCREHGISESQFHSWQRELRLRDAEQNETPSNSAKLNRAEPFVPVQLVSNSCSAAIEIIFGERLRVIVTPGFDIKTLAQVLLVLENRGC